MVRILRQMWEELADAVRPEPEPELSEDEQKQQAAREAYYRGESADEIYNTRYGSNNDKERG